MSEVALLPQGMCLRTLFLRCLTSCNLYDYRGVEGVERWSGGKDCETEFNSLSPPLNESGNVIVLLSCEQWHSHS